MTAIQASAMDRALTRAHKSELHIVGHGFSTVTGDRVIAVSSARDAVRAHCVTIQGNRLACDCEASQHGRYCSHRALVHEVLASERLEAEAARQAGAGHETALLLPVRGNAAVSMWK